MRATSETSFAERRSGIDRRERRTARSDALHSVLERMADGVLIVSRDGVIQFANPAAAALFGRSVHDLHALPFGFPVVAGDSTEIELLRPGGGHLTVELRAADYDWKGRSAVLMSLRDITDRKSLEHERLARARAEAASQAKSEFLGLMSHELRTPLNAVIGYAQLLLDDSEATQSLEQKSKLGRILASAQHLRELVDEMLDLAEAAEGRLALGCGAAPAARPAEQAVEAVRALASTRGVHLSTACTEQSDLTFAGDERRVRQILGLLLDNAIRFTPCGGRVSVHCGRVEGAVPDTQLNGSGPWARWQVVDTGIGIPATELQSIFEPFVQVVGGRTREVDGSGLGLTVARSLARLMKGDLTVESEAGRGSTFSLWLPTQ